MGRPTGTVAWVGLVCPLSVIRSCDPPLILVAMQTREKPAKTARPAATLDFSEDRPGLYEYYILAWPDVAGLCPP